MSKSDMEKFLNAYEFIQKQKIIRMSVQSAGGYGDQVACLHAIRWLRAAGFTGQIEIIYGPIVYKLVTLLGIEDQFIYGIPFELALEKINLIPIDLLEHRLPVELFIAPTASVAFGRPTPFLENNFKAKYAVVFEHYPKPGLKQAIHFPIPTVLEAARFLDDPSKHFLLTRKPGLPTLMRMIAQKHVKTWSLYGLDTEFENINATTIIRLIWEIANKLNIEGIVEKPIALLLHNQLSRKDQASLLEENLSFLDLRDPDFELKSTQIQNKPVWIVNLGSLPTLIFDALIRESSFPVLLEGANLENIMLELGRPYLECGFNGEAIESYIQKFVDSERLKLDSKLQSIVKKTRGELCMPNSASKPEIAEALYQFVLSSLDTHSSLSQLMTLINITYHAPGNDRYLNSLATRLGKPAITSYPAHPFLKEKYPVKGSCNKEGIGLLLLSGKPAEISNCILSKKFNLSEAFSNLRRGIKDPVFFYLLANSNALIPGVIFNYLQKNLPFCQILREAETCLPHMRDMSLTGNIQTVTAVIESCHAKVSTLHLLQDKISEFCHEPLFPTALVPAQQAAHQLIQYLAFNKSMADTAQTPSVAKFDRLILLLGSALVILILAIGLFRNTDLISRNINLYRLWTPGSRKDSSQNSSEIKNSKLVPHKIG